jgi:branched-subunit amino acid transport protein
MTRSWLVVILLGASTMAIKAVGPLLLADRTLPLRLLPVLRLLAPALIAALVVTQVFAHGQRVTIDARVAGLAVAVVGACRRDPPPLVLLVAAAVTAALRARWP